MIRTANIPKAYPIQFSEARKSLSLSQFSLAARAGIHQAELSKLERGISNPSISTLTKIADAMGLSLEICLIDKKHTMFEHTGISRLVIEEIIKHAIDNDLSRVILFGSRARGDFKRKSDIDLAVSNGNKKKFASDVDSFTSTLLMFDFVDLDHDLDEELKCSIERDGILLYEKI